MLEHEFNRIMGKYFHSNAYRHGELELIWEATKSLNADSFESIVRHFIEVGDRPKVAAFRAKAKSYNAYCNDEKQDERPPHKTECLKCMDTGVFEIKSLIEEFEGTLFIGCPCINESKWGIPLWVNDMSSMFKPQKIDVEKWMPQDKNLSSQDLNKVASKWLTQINRSRNYYKGLGHSD